MAYKLLHDGEKYVFAYQGVEVCSEKDISFCIGISSTYLISQGKKGPVEIDASVAARVSAVDLGRIERMFAKI